MINPLTRLKRIFPVPYFFEKPPVKLQIFHFQNVHPNYIRMPRIDKDIMLLLDYC